MTLLPECIEEFATAKIKFKELPFVSLIILSGVFSYSIISIFWIDLLYIKNTNLFYSSFRKTIFLTPPAICLAWYPYQKTKKQKLLKLLVTAVIAYTISLIFIHSDQLINDNIRMFFKQSTAFLSGQILDLVKENRIIVEENFYILNNHKIIVQDACSGFPQIGLTLQSLIVFWMCCPIKSWWNILIIVLLSTITAFFINVIRISLLGIIISKHGEQLFHFWHIGLGSLIFTLIVMTISSTIYYCFWKKEYH